MVEKRFYKPEEQEIRAYTNEDNKKIIEGYAAKFNVDSRLLAEGGKVFTERLLPGAFTDVLKNDVYMTFNHDRDKVFARTINETLVLEEDETGLKFRAELNNTSGAQDLYTMIERGDVFENSFAFTVDDEGQRWSRTPDGDPIREISRINRLYDISTVTHAAYPETEVSVVRGLDEFLESETNNDVEDDFEKLQEKLQEELDRFKRHLKIIKLKK